MIDVQIIDNTDSIFSVLNKNDFKLTVFNDEIKALHAAESQHAAVIVLNYQLLQHATAEFISFLNRFSRDSKVLLIAPSLNDDEVIECMVAGAHGFLQIEELDIFIHKAIDVIVRGEAWLSRQLSAKLLRNLHGKSERLTQPAYQFT